MRIAALDIGGTSIKSGLWDGERLSREGERDTNAREGGARLIERAVEILREYAPFDAIGISTAGQVDTVRGSIYYANDNIPGYTGIEVRRILEDAFHVPVAVENDVNAAALGEAQFGAGKGYPDFLCLTYGTGVGGAIVLDGRIYTGSSWSAGSFGGIVIHPEAVDLAKRALAVDLGLTSGRAIFAAFDRPEVHRVIDEWIDEIVTGLVTLIHIFNPSRIVLGGGIMVQPYVLEQVQERLIPRLSPGFRKVNIARASLGNQAGLLGAAHLAEEML